MKVLALVAVPPGVVIAILPVFASVGTVAVTCESEFTVKAVALTPPNVTLDACVRPLPVITTEVPTVPLVGLKLRRAGTTVNTLLLVRVPVGVDPTGAETVLHSFGAQSTDGYGPGGLTLDSAGNLYGTTEFGGAYRSGTVFKVTPDGTEIVLYSFGATLTDGLNPFAGVILDSAGNLYGTTADGGSLRNGTVFRVDPSGTETVLYSFAGYPSDGATPTGSLVRDAAGNLYGTTSSGGSMNYGVVFKLDATGKETLLHDFVGLADGATPGDLVRDASGNLYGPAGAGGVGRCGVVFKVDTTGKLTLLHTFTGHGDGSGPGSLTLYKGDLYGTTGYGGAPICNFREGIGCGVVFKLNTSGKLTVLYQLTGGKDGATPVSVLAHDNEDNWYGAAASGGSEGDGVVFMVKP